MTILNFEMLLIIIFIFKNINFPIVSNGGKDVMKVEDSYLQQAQQHPVRPWSDQASDVCTIAFFFLLINFYIQHM